MAPAHKYGAKVDESFFLMKTNARLGRFLTWMGVIYLIIMLSSPRVFAQPILLEQQQDFLPLKNLDAYHMQVSCSDSGIRKIVEQEIEWYVSERSFSGSVSAASPLRWLILTESDGSMLQNLQVEQPTIVIFSGVSPIRLPNAMALIYLAEPSPQLLRECVQAVFGGHAFEHQLSEGMGPFPRGAGQKTPGGLRLKKAPDNQNQQELIDTLNRIVEQGLIDTAYPGAQVLVALKGNIVFSKTYGYHTFESKRPVLPEDVYDLASVTKVTAAVPSLMHLLDENLISLEDDLCTLWPFLCRGNKADIGLRPALSHQARLIPYLIFWQDLFRRNGRMKRSKIRSVASKKHSVEITDSLFLHSKYYKKMYKQVRRTALLDSARYLYSGLTFLLYPDLVQRKTGMRIDSFLYQKFYGPLGANYLMYRPADRLDKTHILPTEVDTSFRQQLVHGRVHDEASAMLDGLSTNAGLFGNANDLAKLCQLFLNRGTYGGERFVSSEVVDEFTRRHFAHLDNRRGLGFDKPVIEWDADASYVAQSASPASYGHSGFTGTFFWIDPEKELILIFLSNRVYPTRDNRKLYSLGIRPRLHQAVYDWIEKNQL